MRVEFWSDTLFLPLPATKEWGEDRGEGRIKASGINAPPLPGPLLHPMEEREWLRLLPRQVHQWFQLNGYG